MRKWFLGLVKKDHKYVLTNWKPNAECNANASRMQALLELLKFHTKSTQLGPLDASYQYQEIEAASLVFEQDFSWWLSFQGYLIQSAQIKYQGQIFIYLAMPASAEIQTNRE